jgi:hypothetical protein
MLLIGSENEFCELLPSLFQSVAYQHPAVDPSVFPAFFIESLYGDLFLDLPSFSFALIEPLALCCVLVFSSLFIVQCFFFFGFVFVCQVVVSLPRVLCWFIPGTAGGIPRDTWCSPVGLPNVYQAGLEPASGNE